jgi:hypothetical protein
MLLQSSSRGPSTGSPSSTRLAALGLLTAAVLASGVGVRADGPVPVSEPPVVEHVIVTLDDLPVVHVQDAIVKLLDDEQQDKKDDQKKDKEKSEKRRVIVIQQDGKNIVTIPADADVEEVKRMVEKAMAEAKKQGDGARKAAAEAREQAQRAAEKGRRIAEEAREAAEKGRKSADEARRAAEADRKAIREKMTQEKEKAREKITKDKVESGETQRKAELDKAQGRVRVIRAGESRLGLRLEKPSAAMMDQLNLSDETGLVIVEVAEGSAAAKAGFKANDILVELAGEPVRNDAGTLTKKLREMKGDEAIEAVVLRKGRKVRVRNIKLGEAKSGPSAFEVVPGKGVLEFKGGKDFNFEGFKKLDPAHFKQLELKLDKMPEMKFDVQLDFDGKKLSQDIQKQIELKLEPLQKQLDPKKLQDLQKQIEMKIAPLHLEKFNADDLKKQIEVIVNPQVQKLQELQNKVHVLADPARKNKSTNKGEKSSNTSVTVTVNDGDFKAVQKEENLEITVTGEVAGEKVKVREIRIYGDGEKATYKSVDDVPEKYRDKVKKLTANRDGSPVRFHFNRDEQ